MGTLRPRVVCHLPDDVDTDFFPSVISAEKGVLSSAERLAVDMQTAASRLPVYGQQEGPDLQDVLNHSSTLLSQLSVAMRTFAQHEASMRACFKRIREREEQLDELRRRRRTTGQKAETAERKLAKMGPENKQLVQQTELLEQLRNQMRQLDSDIVNEEAKNGDFKRQ
jgi:DNA repair ATPase RecN